MKVDPLGWDFFRVFTLIIFSVLFMGTTYVIKEGNVEVGRYEEADGREAVEEIPGDAAQPPRFNKETAKDQTDVKSSDEIGRFGEDKNKTWTIQGRVLDFLTGAP